MEEKEINKIKLHIEKFKENQRIQNKSQSTISSYSRRLDSFVSYLKNRDEQDITSITQDTIYQYQIQLCNEKKKTGQPISLSYQESYLVALRVFFRYLTKQGIILADPTSIIDYPLNKRLLPKIIMTPKEIKTILNQPDTDTLLGLRDKAFLETLYATGIRSQELINTAMHDIDLANQMLHVRHTKGGRERIVPLGEIASKYIELYINNARPKLAAWNKEPIKILFISCDGKKLTPATLGKRINDYVKKAGINKTITPHTFRHTCATHMLKGKASIRHIQEMLGHKNLNTTQIYTHVEIGDLKKEHKRTHPREQTQ